MKAKRPSIFWNGCVAHCIDLMLEDIGKLKQVAKTIAQTRQVTVFLYAHTRVLALMRDVLGNDLVRAGITRFATAYVNLKSLQDNKKQLQKLFRSEELDEMGYLKKAKGRKAMKTMTLSGNIWTRLLISLSQWLIC
jgi:predicted amino acid racemase